MLFYNDLIMPQGEYTYSANVQFDIVDDKKLMRFIPNETSIELLKQYFVDIVSESPNHHSRILYGSYGTGKSHFLTVLSLLLGKIHVDGVAFNTFLSRISKLDDELSNDIEKFVKNDDKKPFLIVPIVFDFEDFDRSIYFSLQKALEGINVNITFKNYYSQALALIQNWCKNKSSKDKLYEICKQESITLSSLKKDLRMYSSNVIKTFNKIFSEMTYGVQFVYEITNLSETIKQAYSAISDKYSGFVFIFDEFGRYIEDNIKKIRVKQIQDLAEYCDHEAGNNHVILVSHKEISLYTKEYNDSIANEWKKVEGRYTSTPINDKQDQCLTLISNVLDKNPDVWLGFKKRFNKELQDMYNSASDFKGFLLDKKTSNPYEGAFPLHPITLFALDRLSKKVAQNDRTFFTYLSSFEDNSLNCFLTSHELDKFSFVGVDDLFDYFELSIKAVQSSKAYGVYKDYVNALAKGALDSLSDSIEVRVLKTLAIINIIEDTSALNANLNTFLTVIDADEKEILDAITSLSKKKIIKFFGTYNQYRFYESSIYDIDELIKERISGISDESVSSVLNEHFVNFVLFPHSYNSEYKVNRVFVPIYATVNDLAKNNSFVKKLPRYYDGALIMLISSVNDNNDFEKFNLDRSILFVNKDTTMLIKAVKEYIAILNLESIKEKYTKDDPYFERELDYCKNEQFQVVNKYIKEWITFQIEEYEIFSDGIKCSVNSFRELGQLASEICKRQFSKTLIVNNELINKNIISGSMRNARNKAVEAMIKNESKNYYGLQLLSPEYLIVRSVLAKNGLLFEDSLIEINRLSNGYSLTNDIKLVFNKFFKDAKNSFVEILDLYNELKSPPYGLRDGYLPVMFAAMFLKHKSNLIITSHGVEQEITVDLFSELVSRPKDYMVSIANWSENELRFIDDLQKLFADNIKEEFISKNRLKAIYEAMFSHYKLISKFSRTTQVYVSDDAKAYRKIMETTHNDYTKFIFNDLVNLSEDDLITTLRVIKNIKSELESSLDHLVDDVILNIKMVMDWNSEKLLAKLFLQEYENEWKPKRQKSFDFLTNSFLDCVSKLKKSDKDVDVLNNLAIILTGFECEYWSDKHRDEFIAKLTQIKATLDKYELSDDLNDSEIQVSLTAGNGMEKKVKFDKKNLTPLGETMKNKIGQTLDNFGMAVPYDDKVQIILTILEELIEGK